MSIRYLGEYEEFSKIRENLFICNYNASVNRKLLKDNCIEFVINLEDDKKFFSEKGDGDDGDFTCQYFNFEMLDYNDEHFRESFTKLLGLIIEKIDELRKKGSVLIHCRASVGRSPSCVIGYLMKKEKMSFKEAYDDVRKCHSVADPEDEFIEELKTFDSELKRK